MRTLWVIAGVLLPSVAVAGPAEHLLAGDGLALVAAADPGDAPTASVSMGWDEPRHGVTGVARAQATLGHGVFVVGGASHDASAEWRPHAGVGVQLIASDSLDLAVSAHYKAEGFTEPEGEIELVAAAGRRFGRAYALIDGVYGQDIDARDRDAEVAAAVMAPVGPVVASMSSRARFALASQTELQAAWDAVVDCGAAVPVSRYAIRAAVGVSALRQRELVAGPLASITATAYF